MILNTATLIHVSSAHEGEKDGKQKKKNIIILVLKARYLDRIRRSGTGTVEVLEDGKTTTVDVRWIFLILIDVVR